MRSAFLEEIHEARKCGQKMIDRGKVPFDGPLQAIKARFGRERVIRLVLHEACPEAAALAAQALTGLLPAGDTPVPHVRQPEPHRLTVQFDAAHTTAAAVAGRLLPVLPVHDFQIEEPSVESIIRRLYEGTLRLAEDGQDSRNNSSWPEHPVTAGPRG